MGAPSTASHRPQHNNKTNNDVSSSSHYLSLIQQYIHVFRYENAIFLAERCVAEFPADAAAVYWLAVAYYRNGQIPRARHLLSGPTSSSSSQQQQQHANTLYLSAQCSYELKEYTQAEDALLRECRFQFKQQQQPPTTLEEWILQTTPCPIPNGAAGLALLGDIFRKSNRTQRAIQYYQMSLQLDPFLWSSFQALADLGVVVDVPTVFGVHHNTTNNNSNNHATEVPPSSKTPLQPKAALPLETPGLTPIHQNTTMEEETSRHHNNNNNASVLRRARQVASRSYYPPSPETPSLSNVTRSMRYLQGLGESEPRSLFLDTTTLDEKGGGDDVQPILQTLATVGQAYQELSQYQCQACLDTLKTLPLSHQNTSWVLHQQGKAYLELNQFTAAQRCLEHMKHVEPGRLEGLELLSTVYWQLKKEVALASLAQHVVAWNPKSPQAWCVVGNCFSLQKDHEAALTFFKRSLQLDPDFTYTHTLCGYEYMANEDFEPAMACFRQAIRTNERHYNAWYGLGCIYHRQEKYDLAEYHFERACQIHPSSSILRCNWGISQHANGKAYQALETLSEASRLDPGNAQARFQRATIYNALHRPLEAAMELEKVRDAAPREATVHFCLGKVYKRVGRLEDAMKCFLVAMDLDPKDSQMIKSAMDKLDNPDIDEEAMLPF